MHPDSSISQALEGLVYSRPNLKDYTLDENNLERTCPLDLGRHPINPQHDLGILDVLPLENLSDILVQLDVRSLMDFRRINQRAMQVVDSIPLFRTIISHGISALRGVLSIEAGSHITCQDLYCAITSFRCKQCNDFAGFIYILDCSRVCFLCFTEEPRYLPISASEASRNFGLHRSLLANLRGMKSVPGCYSPHETTCRTRLSLIDPEAARCAGIAFHGSVSAMEQHVAQVASTRLRNYHERVARKAGGGAGPNPRQPPGGSGGNFRLLFAKRFMALVRAPSLSSPAASEEWGFHCTGCKRQYRARPLHWRRKYTVGTFNDHVVQCGPIIGDEHRPTRADR